MERFGRYESPLERGGLSATIAFDTQIVSRAREAGYSLVQYETDTGQLVFEWRRGDERGPQFLTRHLAWQWLVSRFERGDGVLDIAGSDRSFDSRIDALRD